MRLKRLLRQVRACACMLAVLLPACPLSAQTGPGYIPDTETLLEVRFFGDTALGRRLLVADSLPPEDPARAPLLAAAWQQALHTENPLAQQFAAMGLAQCFLKAHDRQQAFRWLHQAIELDARVPALSPVRQAIQSRIGGFYGDFQAYRLALPYLRTGLEADLRRDPQPTARRYRFCSSYAICLEKAGQRDSADQYYRAAIRIAAALEDAYWLASAYNNYGMTLQSQGNRDSAQYYYSLALKTLPHTAAAANFSPSIQDNLGQVLALGGQHDTAAALFTHLYQSACDQGDDTRAVSSAIRAAESHTALGRYAAADALLQAAGARLPRLEARPRAEYWPLWQTARIHLETARRDWYAVTGLQQALITWYDSLAQDAVRGKLQTLENELLEAGSTWQAELEASRLRAAETQARERFTRLLLISLLLLVALLFLILLLSHRRKLDRERALAEKEAWHRHLAELRLRNESLEKEKLNHELLLKERDLTDVSLAYTQRRKIITEMLESLRKIRNSQQPGRDVQDLIQTLRAQLEGEEQVQRGAEHPDKVNHSFFEKLQARFAGLTPAELDLCGLLRLRYSNKDIATIRNIAPASVRIARFRLKKKLGLGPEDDLTDFLVKL